MTSIALQNTEADELILLWCVFGFVITMIGQDLPRQFLVFSASEMPVQYPGIFGKVQFG